MTIIEFLNNLDLNSLLIGLGLGFIVWFVLWLLYIVRTTKKTTINSGQLKEIKQIMENKPKYKLLKGIEIVDMPEEMEDDNNE